MYAVTGAAGFIGSHLVETLRAAGHDVVAVDAFTDHYDPALKEQNATGLDVVRLDLSEDPLDDLVRNVDGIFHLAAKPSVRSGWGTDFQDYVRDNITASQRLFDAAAAAGVRVVWASSSSVYGEAESYPTSEDAVPAPISPYGVTKLTCERLAFAYGRSFGLDAIAMRLFTVYGPRQRPDMAFTRIAQALAEGRPFELYGDGSQSRGFTYVADAVAAMTAAMEHAPAGAVYNVGGGSEATMREAIELFERVSGRKLNLHVGERMVGDVRRTAPDTTRIRGELGWEPRVGLEEGLSAQWEWASARAGRPATTPR
jgi:nucleoside-diphosphate-sugar epimerase